MNSLKWFDFLAFALLIVGGLNWGLVGLFNFNLVEFLFGESLVAKGVFVVVGLAGVYSLFTFYKLLSSREKASS